MISPTMVASSTTGMSLRRWRRIAASITQISSSAWHGLVIHASAPSRRPRTRWATDDGPVQTITASPGSREQTRSRYSQLPGPTTARSTTSAFRRMDTSASAVTALESARRSQPSASSRFDSTCMKPGSRSMTASRSLLLDRCELVGAVLAAEASLASGDMVDTVEQIGGEVRQARYPITGSSHAKSGSWRIQ